MRLVCFLFACCAVSACAGSAPVTEALPPAPRIVRPPAPPPPPPTAPVAVAAPEPPPAPPPTPRGTVSTRAYYEPVDVTEIVLSNGATVVVKPLQAPLYLLALDCSASPAGGGGRVQNLETAFRAGVVPSPSAVYVFAGDIDPQAAEFAAAQALVFGRVYPPDGVVVRPNGHRLPTAPGDVAFDVLAEILNARAQNRTVRVARDVCAGTTTLYGDDIAPPPLAGLQLTADEVAAARARVLAVADDPQRWAEALAALYVPPGSLRPSQSPAVVAGWSNRVARVSVEDVARLAQRLGASTNP